MVIVKLTGGLGNQMFQYAAARRLALVNEDSLKLDLSWFESIPRGDTPRQYELHVFNSVQDVASPKEVEALRGMDIVRWPKVVKTFLNRTGLLMKQSCVREKHYHFDPEILQLHGDIYLDGYWQSEKYFEDAEKVIRSDFTIRFAPDPVNMEISDAISSSEAVSVHVRRGDYVANKAIGQYHGVSTIAYYKAAIAAMITRVRNPRFFVFSDDPAWVKNNLTVDVPMTYFDNNNARNAYEDLMLMSQCRHHIIANSSFSWWGAWLSLTPEKVVIAPQKWFALGDTNTDDLIPQGWLRL